MHSQNSLPPSSQNLESTTIPLTTFSLPILPSHPQCRICSSSQTSSSNKMISPCQCSGSVKFTHEQCLKEWIQTRWKKIGDSEENRRKCRICQLCKNEMMVEYKMKRSCRNGEEFCQVVKNKKAMFAICVIAMLFILAIVSYASVQLANQLEQGYDKVEKIDKIVVIVSFPVNLILFLFFCYQMGKFGIKWQMEVDVGKAGRNAYIEKKRRIEEKVIVQE